MQIEIVTTKKKLTKSIVKQMDEADWAFINEQLKNNPHTEFFKINDVFKFPVVIFLNWKGDWSYFPLHKYTLSADGLNAYINNARHVWIRNKNSAELFIENVELINRTMKKIII
jgi:hypothetical protein